MKSDECLEPLMVNLEIKELNSRSLAKRYDCVKGEIDDLRQENIRQFEFSQRSRLEMEGLTRRVGEVEEENVNLKNEIACQRERSGELSDKLSRAERELEEFKRIKLIQENCIDRAEFEIEKLQERVADQEKTMMSITENVEISQVINLKEIVDDLKMKLILANTEIEKYKNNCHCDLSPGLRSTRFTASKCKSFEGLHTRNARDANVSVTVEQPRLSSSIPSNIETQMPPEMRDFTLSAIGDLMRSAHSVNHLPSRLIKMMNKKYGKYWHCFMAEKLVKSQVKYIPDTFVSFELSGYHFALFQTARQTVKEKLLTEILTESRGDKSIKIYKKSVSVESEFEKFVLRLSCDGLDRRYESFNELSGFIRDAICAKYSTQWFVSVGESKYYGTSWSLAKSRKFILFEINNVKFTIGEVGGWFF